MGKTWGPRGETPALPHNFGPWEKVSMVSAVGAEGATFFRLKRREPLSQADLARFLRHLLRHVPGNLAVFWDGASHRKGPEIRKVVEDHPRLPPERLPPYGFDYNHDEGVWDALKWGRLRNFTPHGTGELVGTLRRELRGLQRKPRAIASFFLKSELPRKDVELLLNQDWNL